MVTAKNSFKHRFVAYDDDDDKSWFWLLFLCWSMIVSMPDGLDTDDDTCDGLILGIIECNDDGPWSGDE
jgi:hypothetical protein